MRILSISTNQKGKEMRHCNFIITDTLNKRNDVVYFIKSQFFNGVISLEEKILKIADVKKTNLKELVAMHKSIPDNFKHINDKNIGCA